MVLQRNWCNPLWERMMPYYIIWVILNHWSWSRSFQRGWATILHSEHLEVKETWESTKDHYHTFRHTTYNKAIRLPLPSNINHFHGIEHGRGCVNKSSLVSTTKWTGTSSNTVGKNFIIWKLIIKVEWSVSEMEKFVARVPRYADR